MKKILLFSQLVSIICYQIGKAHIGYISNGNVIGLSKINRIVQYYAQRPQVQERLTLQIVKELQEVLKTEDVACVIDAKHLCVNQRGIKDVTSSTVTSEYGGVFKNQNSKQEFLDYIKTPYKFYRIKINICDKPIRLAIALVNDILKIKYVFKK